LISFRTQDAGQKKRISIPNQPSQEEEGEKNQEKEKERKRQLRTPAGSKDNEIVPPLWLLTLHFSVVKCTASLLSFLLS
jgi:hypothetical protein